MEQNCTVDGRGNANCNCLASTIGCGNQTGTLAAADYLDASVFVVARQSYAPNADLTNPLVSPIFGDFSLGFPPVLVQVGARMKLIEAAIACLHRTGYSATTVSTVATEAGVSRGAMTHQFPAKTDLMLASRADPGLAERLRELQSAIDERSHKWSGERVRAAGIEPHPDAAAIHELYVAAVRGVVIEATFMNHRDGVQRALRLLSEMMRGFYPGLGAPCPNPSLKGG